MDIERRTAGIEMDVSCANQRLGGPTTYADGREQYGHLLLSALTDKEIDVLRFLDRGATNKEMSRGLLVTENTIKFHLKNIYGKLNVTNRLQALIAARALGLIGAADRKATQREVAYSQLVV